MSGVDGTGGLELAMIFLHSRTWKSFTSLVRRQHDTRHSEKRQQSTAHLSDKLKIHLGLLFLKSTLDAYLDTKDLAYSTVNNRSYHPY